MNFKKSLMNYKMSLIIRSLNHTYKSKFYLNLLGIQSKLFTSTFTCEKELSYVGRCKYTQELKEDKTKCLELLPQGKFLVYCGAKPLMKTFNTSGGSQCQELLFLSFDELIDYKSCIMQSHVLLSVDNHKVPQYSVQLGKLNAEAATKFEASAGGSFFDLRLALFMVNWSDAHILSRANALLMFNRNNAFCGRCGGKTIRNAPGNLRTCKDCGHSVYPSSNPVGIVLVTDPERKHALLVRQPGHPPGMFTCIAGFGDVGESLEETVKREVAEEVGLEVKEVQYVASQHWPFPGSLMAGCYAVTEKAELSIDEAELENALWYTREEIGGAIKRIQDNPFLRIGATDKTELYIPPPGAIAYSLILHWYRNTPANEVYRHIYNTN